MGISFRALRAEEVECRIGQIAKNGSGLSLLLFKTARTDMDILDETVGPDNWQCKFYEQKGTLFCSTGIRFEREDGSCEWVWKDDAGSPSNMEAAKGEASDCRKRSGVCWGIGRELYTAPRIWIYAQNRDGSTNCTIKPGSNGKMQCYDRFSVSSITVERHTIEQLEIRNDDTGRTVFQWCSPEFARRLAENQPPTTEQLSEMSRMIEELAKRTGATTDTVIAGLANSNAVKASGVVDNRFETARQVQTAMHQLRVWIDSRQQSMEVSQ